ncbi:MAG: co-chaperone GroES [Campylobacter sp.]|nr:co-chaperone GroES [Campylobacter sp.]MDY5384336.1 co-chaperone GroES [Campylobacter sp.]
MQFQPLGKRVLVERQEEATTTVTGIIIPDNASKEKPQQGKVVAVSEKIADKGIEVGDQVVFGKYTGTEVAVDDKKYLVLNLEDILGILK